MALDGLVIHALVHELQACVGGRVGKIHQPSESDIVMSIRSQGSNFKLLISANPTYPRVHWTRKNFQNPLEAPMFCMLLRKHIEGGVIESVEQVNLERIIHIHVRQRDELGDLSSKTLVIELMGRHSNVILLDPLAGTIIDGIRHVTPAISSYRVVMPGSAYTPPPAQGKSSPLGVTKEQFMSLMRKTDAAALEPAKSSPKSPETAAQRIVNRFNGISPLVAGEIVHRGGIGNASDASALDDDALQSLWSGFMQVIEPVGRHDYRPSIVEANNKSFFSVVELTHLEGRTTLFNSVSECLEAFYGDKAERDAVKQRVADLLRFLQNEKAKNEKKLEKLNEAIREAQDADRYRIVGELLTASMHLMNKGDKQIEVINYYDEEQRPITITLDPLLTPSENVQRYFKKYTKLKHSLVAVQQQIESARAEIAYFDTLLQQLENADLHDIEEIRDELAEQGYIRDRHKKARKLKKKDKPLLTCYTSSEGIPVYVGKNNTQNEYLTNRLARPGDTWLHTKDIPGSHVVIRSERFGKQTLEEAAQLAAYFSQARESSRVPVDYTLIRHVRKPNGSKPGFVIYDHQKTLFVTPDASLISKLKVETKS